MKKFNYFPKSPILILLLLSSCANLRSCFQSDHTYLKTLKAQDLWPVIITGDVNMDGQVNEEDYALVRDGAAAESACERAGDLNFDGKTNRGDLRELRKLIQYQGRGVSPHLTSGINIRGCDRSKMVNAPIGAYSIIVKNQKTAVAVRDQNVSLSSRDGKILIERDSENPHLVWVSGSNKSKVGEDVFLDVNDNGKKFYTGLFVTKALTGGEALTGDPTPAERRAARPPVTPAESPTSEHREEGEDKCPQEGRGCELLALNLINSFDINNHSHFMESATEFNQAVEAVELKGCHPHKYSLNDVDLTWPQAKLPPPGITDAQTATILVAARAHFRAKYRQVQQQVSNVMREFMRHVLRVKPQDVIAIVYAHGGKASGLYQYGILGTMGPANGGDGAGPFGVIVSRDTLVEWHVHRPAHNRSCHVLYKENSCYSGLGVKKWHDASGQFADCTKRAGHEFNFANSSQDADHKCSATRAGKALGPFRSMAVSAANPSEIIKKDYENNKGNYGAYHMDHGHKAANCPLPVIYVPSQ